MFQDDDNISGTISASDMAGALIRSCGTDLALKKVQAHIARSIETQQEGEAIFWSSVRDSLRRLIFMERDADDVTH